MLLTVPDKEVDAGDAGEEENNGIHDESDSVPEGIKSATLLHFDRHVPLGRCCSIQAKDSHGNDPCTRWHCI